MDFTDFDSYIKHFNLTEEDIVKIVETLKSTIDIFSVSSSGVVTFLAILYGFISLVAVFGNGLVILVVLKKKNMQTLTNIFIANLAFADVALGIFVIPFQFQAVVLQRWVFSDFMCNVAPFVKILSVNVSVLTLTLIAIDRYMAVIHPLHAGFRKRVAVVVLLVIWLISTLSALPVAFYYTIQNMFRIKDIEERKRCVVKWPSENIRTYYCSYLILLQYLVPLSVITFSYVRITCRIWGSTLPGNEMNIRRETARNSNRKKVGNQFLVNVRDKKIEQNTNIF